ncbi:hypothetical protein L596_002091 [Steinernema carpocapsae]|uniref:Uncharacterized protein n=1 Tax=Steinernema carpocapsae TaxID=34508 RepID=A0A4V6I7J9_STECR|nr:hypothetical protein L596_002091 [Steinernema carpocapsae]
MDKRRPRRKSFSAQPRKPKCAKTTCVRAPALRRTNCHSCDADDDDLIAQSRIRRRQKTEVFLSSRTSRAHLAAASSPNEFQKTCFFFSTPFGGGLRDSSASFDN